MLKQFFGSAEIIWLDRAAVLLAVEKAVERLTRDRPEVQRVILFGSLARGDAVPGSDVDLLILIAESDRPFLDRIPRYRPRGVPIGVDVFPYTQEELNQMLAEGNFFAAEAISQGIVLFERTEPTA